MSPSVALSNIAERVSNISSTVIRVFLNNIRSVNFVFLLLTSTVMLMGTSRPCSRSVILLLLPELTHTQVADSCPAPSFVVGSLIGWLVEWLKCVLVTLLPKISEQVATLFIFFLVSCDRFELCNACTRIC